MTHYALIIGICYKNTKKRALPGVENDVKSVIELLNSWGFRSENMMILSDTDISNRNAKSYRGVQLDKPTSLNITTQLNNFCSKLVKGDTLVFYYSGHGLKSSLIPIDDAKVDSEAIRYYLNKIDKDVNVLCIFDCCNSGTVCNLKYHLYDTSYRKDIRVKIKNFNESFYIQRQNHKISSKTQTYKSVNVETDANIISISGCWDDEVSYDLGKNGALTMVLLHTLNERGLNVDFKTLLQNLRGRIIQLRLKQNPQIMLGNDVDLNVSLKSYLKI
jgi:hypothetical protein